MFSSPELELLNSKQSRRESGRMRNHRVTPLWRDFFVIGELNPVSWGCRSAGRKGKTGFDSALTCVTLPQCGFPWIFLTVFYFWSHKAQAGHCCHCTHTRVSYLIQSLGGLRKGFPRHFHCCWHLDQHPNLFIWHFPFPVNLWIIPPETVRAGNALSPI